jgi:pSer/pThr/pTyr-binding forkhead associated (FHA) protein
MGPHAASETKHRLMVVSPGPFQGTTWEIGERAVVLGRAADADLHVTDPTVSRRHARFERIGGSTVLTDLDSMAGTTVNHQQTQGPVELHDGDEIGAASLLLRFSTSAEGTAVMPSVTASNSSFVVDRQQAHQLNNIAGNQYNQYLQTVHQQRDTFLRDIAATRTRARYLIWIGGILTIAGIGVFFAMIATGFSRFGFPETFEEAEQQTEEPFGPEVGGVPIGIIGWAVAALGMMILIVGIVLHVVATARRRRVEREVVPLPPAAFGAGHTST